VESGDSKGRRYRITPSSKEASHFDGKVASEGRGSFDECYDREEIKMMLSENRESREIRCGAGRSPE